MKKNLVEIILVILAFASLMFLTSTIYPDVANSYGPEKSPRIIGAILSVIGLILVGVHPNSSIKIFGSLCMLLAGGYLHHNFFWMPV